MNKNNDNIPFDIFAPFVVAFIIMCVLFLVFGK